MLFDDDEGEAQHAFDLEVVYAGDGERLASISATQPLPPKPPSAYWEGQP